MSETHYPEDLSQIKELVYKSLQETTPGREDNWTFKSGGADSGTSWRRNMESYQSVGFKMNVLKGVKREDIVLSTDILGRKFDLPIMVAPMSSAINKVCEDPFFELAKGAKLAGIPSSIGYPAASENNNKMLETGSSVFRILKVLQDRDKLKKELILTEKAGFFATGLDIDSVIGLKPSGEKLGHDISLPIDADELKELVKLVNIPFIIKGIISLEDAEIALEAGAAAIVLSTHAGFAMDYCPAPIEVIQTIKDKVGGKMQVFVDSGITRGSDVLKALALGADAVLIGRMSIWGLALGKADGLKWIVDMITQEIKRNMALMGKKNIQELNPDCLVPLNEMGYRILG